MNPGSTRLLRVKSGMQADATITPIGNPH